MQREVGEENGASRLLERSCDSHEPGNLVVGPREQELAGLKR